MAIILKKDNKKSINEIPVLGNGKINVYNSKQILKAGGIEKFNVLIGNDKPKQMPNLGFSEEEWEKMLTNK